MQSIMSAAVMRWWPEAMVPMNRDPVAVREAQALWEANNLYEPFDITGIVAARYGVSCATSVSNGDGGDRPAVGEKAGSAVCVLGRRAFRCHKRHRAVWCRLTGGLAP